jgi:hypothetical protein
MLVEFRRLFKGEKSSENLGFSPGPPENMLLVLFASLSCGILHESGSKNPTSAQTRA